MGEEVFVILLLSIFMSLLFSLPIIILYIAGLWKIFTKAGEEGWKAIVPIYNVYTLCKIVGISPYWLLIILICSILSAIPVIGNLLYLAAVIYFGVILAVSLARSFGKSDTFAIGNYLLSVIFYPILGFGESKYQGPKPMKDPVFEWIEGFFNKDKKQNSNINPANQQPQNNYQQPQMNYEQAQSSQQPSVEQNTNTTTTFQYCPQCGNQLTSQDKFCPNCGRQIN